MENIISLPAADTFTPEQALFSALEFAKNDNLKEVLIIGYDGNNELLIRSSRMDRKNALWLSEKLRDYATCETANYF